jgi:murein DD-endopeptidase MepM/ murein hydrolase activator NlpD
MRGKPVVAGLPFACVMLAGMLLAGLLPTRVAQADDFYRWRDGGLHRDPPPVSTAATARRDPGATPVTLRFEPRSDAIEAWVDNALGGPVEVELREVDLRAARGHAAGAEPPLPVRAVVPARQQRRIARLPPGTDARFALTAIRGAPDARPDDVEYAFPLETEALRVEQGWGGSFSHRDAENRYGVDFGAPSGTPVRAARAGVVMEVEDGFDGGGRDRANDLGRANLVRILHADGTMALYAHLQRGGLRVRVGQRVSAGEPIGLVGATGFATGPHLHFAVQANRGLRLEAIRFRMLGPQGVLRFIEAP